MLVKLRSIVDEYKRSLIHSITWADLAKEISR